MLESQFVTILIVEDDPGHSKLIEKNLRRGGLENPIKAFENGQQALDYLNRQSNHPINQCVLLLLDLNMPVMNGGSEIEFFRLARHGETVKLKARYASITEKETSKGPIILIVSETDYMTGDGELLARQRHTRIRRPVKK